MGAMVPSGVQPNSIARCKHCCHEAPSLSEGLPYPFSDIFEIHPNAFRLSGRFDIVEFWVYIVIVEAVSALLLAILDPDLM